MQYFEKADSVPPPVAAARTAKQDNESATAHCALSVKSDPQAGVARRPNLCELSLRTPRGGFKSRRPYDFRVIDDPNTGKPARTIVHLNVNGHWAPFPDHRVYSGTAWHYTDAAAALSIVRDGEMWASSSLMMNDTGELDYAIDRIRSVFDEWVGQGHPGAHVALASAMNSFEDELHANPPFIVSASRSNRLLNQWANYGVASGFAIGFDAKVPLVPKQAEVNLPDTGPGDWRPFVHGWREVLYDPTEQASHIRTVLDAMVSPDGVVARTVEAGTSRSRVITMTNLALLATTLKDPAFSAEQEVRYTIQLADGMKPDFRATARGIVPFLRLVGTKMDDGTAYLGAPLPVISVTVGPPLASEKRRTASMISLRDVTGHTFSVNSAGIPYLP